MNGHSLFTRANRKLKRIYYSCKQEFIDKTPLFSKEYGKLYLPYYNLGAKISEASPEVFNKSGEKLEFIFIRDICMAHNPYGTSQYFLFDRFNFGLPKHIYTHNDMLRQIGKPQKKYGALIESEAIVPNDYKIFKKNKGLEKDFDKIFTYSFDILQSIPNAEFVPFCSNIWYGDEINGGILSKSAYLEKKRNISIVSSGKTGCELHRLRLEIARKCKRLNLADTYGTFDGGPLVKLAESLTDYRYSIAIENDIKPYFFTERITSCFAAMTIPIYLGATKIDEFFNPDGIIKITEKDYDNLESILSKCTKEYYEEHIEAVIDNFNRVQKYINIWDNFYLDYLK